MGQSGAIRSTELMKIMKDNVPLNPAALELEPPQGGLASFPPSDRWDDWTEYDAGQWPRKVEKHYSLVPTICFNCEAGCGLLAWVDKEKPRIHKFEGNPAHPGSRGRNCAKGPATINQVNDPERILYPLRRAGKRGEGKWERVTWDEVLDDLGGRIRAALQEGRKNEIMYHVGRPGHELIYNQRVLHAWGIDGHNSHTNVCSAGARTGYAFWHGLDRPSPDYANARFILLLSSHLEAGHYFNPHAQRIIDGKLRGAKLAVMDPRLSNTASMADYWLPTHPGSEAAVLLAMANVILDEGLADLGYLERWTNWREFMAHRHPRAEPTFAAFLVALREHYEEFTPAFAEAESGVPRQKIVEAARLGGEARGAFASHVWRGTASGNLGGWQVARALQLLTVLTASFGTPGGTSPNAWNKYKPAFWEEPKAQEEWNELLFPREWPLSHYEMSFLLPHFLKEGRGRLDMYFTRVYNPVWTNPDGLAWIDVLSDESLVGLHAALTPTWSETAIYADFVLPMGHASERHDIQSQETQSGRWVSFRQPVLRVARERRGETFQHTYEANPGQGWGEEALPGYVRSHVHPKALDAEKGEMVLLPTFRLPTLIHTRSGNAKYLNEISHRNPLWIHTSDALRLGFATGDLVRVTTEIGYFVNHAWVTESIAPGVVACSHHLGRWRLHEGEGSRWSSVRVTLDRRPDGTVLMRQVEGISPFVGADPDSRRIWWTDGGVHQNLTFPVHPDPVSGMHCWHHKVVVSLARAEDLYGDWGRDTTRPMEDDPG